MTTGAGAAPRIAVRNATRSPLRAVAVLLVALGILAMHTLAGGSHMATPTMPEQAIADSTAAASMATAADSAPAVVGLPPATSATASNRAAIPGSAGGSSGRAAVTPASRGMRDAMPVCLAVLIALAVLFAVPVAAGTTSRPRVARARPALTSPAGRGPPRALLAQLCVLRT